MEGKTSNGIHSPSNGALYLGFDLSTQQLKGLAVQSDLRLVHEAKVDFDADFGGKYGIEKGVLTNPIEGEVYAPVAMWLEAVDLVLRRLQEDGLDFSRVKGLAGAGMQHGTVFWSKQAEDLLRSLDGAKTLVKQLGEKAFSHPDSPNWQDASTQKQCDMFDSRLGSPEELARVTGSKAHHRFSGPQILRFRQKYPSHYQQTGRISLVSSFLTSLFLGRIAPIDIGDVCGMNLREIRTGTWNESLLELAAGSPDGVGELRAKLGIIDEDGGGFLGTISPYFVTRYGFSKDCKIVPGTGDNPSTILALPLRPSDAMVSLGTSTTFLMSTPEWKPDPAYHFMNHPTTAGLYMFMLCYKNGGLAREKVRDALNALEAPTAASIAPKSWDLFNAIAERTPPLDQHIHGFTDHPNMRLGLYFPRPEIVPNLPAGQWRYRYNSSTHELVQEPRFLTNDSSKPSPGVTPADARTILESQFLSLRLRSAGLVAAQPDPRSTRTLPPQPRRIYLVGGGSANATIARLCGAVLGGSEGVFRLDIGGNACGLGAAYKAVWGVERGKGETFEDLIDKRWDEGRFVKKVAEGYQEGVWERYGEALRGFDDMEKAVLRSVGRG
ncbi:MAG: hypothetical protein M1821_007501 [Bathelium mastoideum]|nr:MAG: hypothetical protein M1821_007501 [Bathelium mastoideum]